MKRYLLIIIAILLTVSAQEKIEFETELLSGETIQFSELYRENVVLVNFWALWCKPCRSEMKALNNIYKEYRAQGFQILGVNLDSPRSAAKVESFVKSLNIEYKITLDQNQTLFEEFNGQVVPLNVLYNKKGEIVYRHTGYLPGDEFKLEEEIKKAVENIE